MIPGYLAIAELNVFQMCEVRVLRVLTVMHVGLDVDDDRILKGGGVIVLLFAVNRRPVPLDFDFAQR